MVAHVDGICFVDRKVVLLLRGLGGEVCVWRGGEGSGMGDVEVLLLSVKKQRHLLDIAHRSPVQSLN